MIWEQVFNHNLYLTFVIVKILLVTQTAKPKDVDSIPSRFDTSITSAIFLSVRILLIFYTYLKT